MAGNRAKLETIHPNPGPREGKRVSLEDRKRKGRQKKKDKWVRETANRRTERCNRDAEGKRKYRRSKKWKAMSRNRESNMAEQRKKRKEGAWIGIWNVQKAAVRTDGGGRIQRILEISKKRKWKILLLSELTGRECGVWWLDDKTVLVHGQKAGVVLREEVAQAWKAVGRNNSEDGTELCGRWGPKHTNEAGGEMMEWMEEINLFMVDSFYQKKNRGTWYHQVHHKWYEMDYFLMRKAQKKVATDVKVIPEDKWSDHRHKPLKLKLEEKVKPRDYTAKR